METAFIGELAGREGTVAFAKAEAITRGAWSRGGRAVDVSEVLVACAAGNVGGGFDELGSLWCVHVRWWFGGCLKLLTGLTGYGAMAAWLENSRRTCPDRSFNNTPVQASRMGHEWRFGPDPMVVVFTPDSEM